MDSKEFNQFMDDTQSILNIKINDLQFQIWYKALKSYSLRDANIMVEKAYQYEQKSRIGLADILKYKTKEQNQSGTAEGDRTECNYCSLGIITAERRMETGIYEYAYSCGCKFGQNVPFPKADRTHILGLHNCGCGRYTIEKPQTNSNTGSKFVGRMKGDNKEEIPI